MKLKIIQIIIVMRRSAKLHKANLLEICCRKIIQIQIQESLERRTMLGSSTFFPFIPFLCDANIHYHLVIGKLVPTFFPLNYKGSDLQVAK